VVIAVETAEFEGATLIVSTVHEAHISQKPVRVRKTGKAYLRQYDGNYPMSDLEEMAFISARTQPTFDLEPVAAASVDDLDSTAVSLFVQEKRRQSAAFAKWSNEEVLAHTGVMTGEHPTLAGLLAFGTYPQGFYPNLAIQASVWSDTPRRSGSRVIDSQVFTGSIPTILFDAINWVARSTPMGIIERSDGNLMNAPEYPARAVRELIANALIHRDLGQYAMNRYSSIEIIPGELRIANPGGLYGVEVESLGHTDSRLRNAQLASILLNTYTPDGLRVIERLGSGIPTAQQALQQAGLPPAEFISDGLSFVAVVRNVVSQRTGQNSAAQLSGSASTKNPSTDLSQTQRAILAELSKGPETAIQLIGATGLTERRVRHALKGLVADGHLNQDKATGRGINYSLA
jgi:ATP-dependent DNA helicase RecG